MSNGALCMAQPPELVPLRVFAAGSRRVNRKHTRAPWLRMSEGRLWKELCLCIVSSRTRFDMALAAVNTRTIKLGTGVAIASNRIPPVTVHSIATINQIAPGRVILGLGTSSPIIVGKWHGLPYEAPLETMREAVEIIRGVLSAQKTDFHGARYSSEGFRMPLLPKRVPIYVGALNDRMLSLAGEIAEAAPLALLSTSPEREDTILMKNPFE